jgi:hypothetical protein
MKKKSIEKGLESYDKIIEEHEEKIKKEKEKESPRFELINYWEKETRSFKKNREKLLKKT